MEDSPTKYRKRRRILRKNRVKNKQKGKGHLFHFMIDI